MKTRNIVLILALVLIIGLMVTTLFSMVKGLTFNYGGVTSNSPGWNFTPALSYSTTENATLYDIGNFNVGFVAYVGDGGLQLQTGICSVSYTASWTGNQPIELYNASLATPENLSGDFSGINSSLPQYFFHSISLTNVPLGPQQIIVTVEGGGYYLPLTTEYYTVYTNASFSLNFEIKAAPSSTPAENSTWNLQTVSADGLSSANCPAVVDSNGVPHVAYTAYTTTVQTIGGGPAAVLPDFVEYSTWNGINWSTQTIGIGTQVYSLTMNSNNTACLVYEGLDGLTYATSTGGNWASQTVDSNGASDAALALDSDGNPHIAYDSGTVVNYVSYTTVKYASWTGSSWQIQIVGNLPANVPAYAATVYLALNQSNTPYVMYGYSPYGNGTDVVQLAIGKSTGWNIQNVTLPSPVGGFGNLVLDSKGYPHLISAQTSANYNFYTPPNNYNLFYASWNGTGWTTQEIASNITLQVNGEDIGSVALDAQNNPQITYATATWYDSIGSLNNEKIAGYEMYASWTGKSWNIQTVGDTPYATEPGFLTLDSSGSPYISFWGPLVSGADYSQGVPILYVVNVMCATLKTSERSTPSPASTLASPNPTVTPQNSMTQIQNKRVSDINWIQITEFTATAVALVVTVVALLRKSRKKVNFKQ